MDAVAALLATVLVVELVFVQPFAGRRRYRRLKAEVATNPDARIRHYRRGIAGEWLAVGVVVVIGLLAGRDLGSIGLRTGSDARAAMNDVLAVAIVLGASAVIFRFGGSNIRALLRRQARGFIELLPRSREERLTFGALAITAGVCEEVVFRGFGIAYVRWLWPAASQPFIIVVTAAAFGFAHLYQGIRGVLLTGLVGAYLAWLTLSTGSLLPAIVVHALIDLRVLALPDLDEVTEPAGYEE
jgi:membrane protease YdiL (CAAX protease family)